MASTLNGTVLRLDDRRIHGQILYGWGVGWPADEIWLVDRTVANDTRERTIYEELIAESGSVGGVLDPADAGTRISALQRELPRAQRLVVFSDPADLKDLTGDELQIAEIDLAHRTEKQGRREIVARVYLGEDEVELLNGLRAKGVPILRRDLPGDEPVPVDRLTIEGGKGEQ